MNNKVIVTNKLLEDVIELLDNVDTTPGSSQRNLDVAIDILVKQLKTRKSMKKNRQYRSNQGRSPERQENIYKGCFWALLMFVITSFIVISHSIITG